MLPNVVPRLQVPTSAHRSRPPSRGAPPAADARPPQPAPSPGDGSRVSEERLRLATTAADIGTWDVDPATGTLFCDAAARRHLGVAPGAELNTYDGFLDTLHPDDRERVDAAVKAAIAPDGPPYDIAYRTIGQEDGVERHVAARGRAVLNEHGVVARFVGTTIDVTSERAAAESLRFLDALSVAAQAAVTAADVIAITTRRLGEHLGVTRCAYADLDEDGTFVIRQDWSTAASSVGDVHRLDAYGPDAASQLRAGRALVLCDVEAEVATHVAREAFRAAGVGAIICCPLMKGGQLHALVIVHTTGPRIWTPVEITLVKAVTERSGSHIERARVEASLRESEERYRVIGDAANDAIWDWDLATGAITWNHGLATAFGHTDTGTVTDMRWWLDRIHPADRQRAHENLLSALTRGDSSWRCEYRFRRADGAYACVFDRGRVLRHPDGTAYRMVGSIQDLTERNRADALRRESEAFMRQLIEHSPDCITVLDRDARVQSMNAVGMRQFAIDDFETVRGRDWRTFWSGDDRVTAAHVFAEVLEGRSARFEGYCPTQTGEPRWWNVVATPLGSGEQVQRVLAVSRDVTETHRAGLGARFLADASATLHDLSDSERALDRIAQLAVESFADRCVIEVADGTERRRIDARAARAGHAARAIHAAEDYCLERVLRTGEAEVVGNVATELLDADPTHSGPLRRLRDLGVRSYLGVPLVVRGEVMGVIAFYVTDSARNFTHVELTVASDLARRVAVAIDNARLYRSIQESDQRKSEFLATLAHELRNPLAPIRTGLEVLARTDSRSPEGAHVRTVMTRQMGHMVRLVDDLLDVSRLSRGKLELKKSRVMLDTVVRDAIDVSRPAIDAARHTLTVTLPETPVPLHGDPTRLSQVISNLLTNAAKYTADGGEIRLAATLGGDDVVIAVTDTGIGLSAEQLPVIFEMFGQIRGPSPRSDGGLGIGLTLVRQLTEMHGGAVVVRSQGPQCGSTFEVRLPVLVARPEPAPQEEVVTSGSTQCLKVLVVDDNRDSAEMLGMLIGMHGHDVRTAFAGPDALTTARDFAPDVVFLDIGLPVMSGYEVAQRLRRSEPTQRSLLVALTGWGAPEHVARARAAGFDVHMTKPVDTTEVERLLSNPDAARRTPSHDGPSTHTTS